MATSLMPWIKAHFDDDDGNPLSFGKVYTYISGSTTLQDTYTDATQTGTNTNPIVLNARGEADIWLDDSLSYKIKVARPDDSEVFTIDNVKSSSSGGVTYGTVYVSASDPVAQYLSDKIVTGTGMTKTIVHDPAGDYIKLESTAESSNSFEAVATTVNLAKGTPVYITGWNSTLSVATVDKTDSNGSGTMPCLGLVAETTLSTSTAGTVISSGTLSGIDTTGGLEAWAINDAIYVSETTGELTNVRPVGVTSGVQKVAQVSFVDAISGVLAVFGAGRVNDVPNVANWVNSGLGNPTSGQQGFDGSTHKFGGNIKVLSPSDPTKYLEADFTAGSIFGTTAVMGLVDAADPTNIARLLQSGTSQLNLERNNGSRTALVQDASDAYLTAELDTGEYHKIFTNTTESYLDLVLTGSEYSKIHVSKGGDSRFDLSSSGSSAYLICSNTGDIDESLNSAGLDYTLHLSNGGSSLLLRDATDGLQWYQDTSKFEVFNSGAVVETVALTTDTHVLGSLGTSTYEWLLEANPGRSRLLLSTGTDRSSEFFSDSTQSYTSNVYSATEYATLMSNASGVYLQLDRASEQSKIAVGADSYVSNGLAVGNSATTNAGTIRYSGTDLEGYVGGAWKSLTASGGSGTVTGTGTHNYVTKWNATGTGIEDSAILDDGTKVEIQSPDGLYITGATKYLDMTIDADNFKHTRVDTDHGYVQWRQAGGQKYDMYLNGTSAYEYLELNSNVYYHVNLNTDSSQIFLQDGSNSLQVIPHDGNINFNYVGGSLQYASGYLYMSNADGSNYFNIGPTDNSYLSSALYVTGENGLHVTGGKTTLAATNATRASLNITVGTTAPTSPVTGDAWYDGTHLYFRNGSSNVDLLAQGIGGSGTVNYLPKFTPDGTTIGDSSVTDDGSIVTVGAILQTNGFMQSNSGQYININEVIGNEAGFYVRDATSGTPVTLFRISSGGSAKFYDDLNVSDTLFVDKSTGLVGVGTIAPAYKLQVNTAGGVSSKADRIMLNTAFTTIRNSDTAGYSVLELSENETVDTYSHFFRIQKYGSTATSADDVNFIHNNGTTVTVMSIDGTTRDLTVNVDTDIDANLTVTDNISSTGQIYSAEATATSAVDWNNGNAQEITLSGATTFTFANGQSGASYLLKVTEDGSAITWPGSVHWPDNTAPTLSAATKVDIFTFYFSDGIYYGIAGLNFTA